jgi:hypothetical protein
MSFLESALELAQMGFHVFPLVQGEKTPLIMDFPSRATRDPATIRKWWIDPVLEIEQPHNIGISTSKFADDEALLVVDVDNKGDKNGDAEIVRLEFEGQTFPETFEQTTPTGGRHLVYRVPRAVKQGADVLAKGLDVRSHGGFIVGAGSRVEKGAYVATPRRILSSPGWLIERCGEVRVRVHNPAARPDAKINEDKAVLRALRYLKQAPLAVEGHAGDQTTFQVAAKLKDIGLPEDVCFEMMVDHWNDQCEPPWSYEELRQKVRNAYAYGANPVGVDAPETQFSPVKEDKKLSPIDKLNKDYAYVVAGGKGHILWETKDVYGNFALEHLDVKTFHERLASETMSFNGKTQNITRVWMNDPRRRTYDGLCFMPGKEPPPRFYNLWKGFSVDPLPDHVTPSKDAQQSLDMFLEHALVNVCQGDEELYKWLIGYFAHLIQKPWEKPLVALVFKGKKGVGKNALIERVGHLLGSSFMVTSDRRYLVGNFNGHLENMLLFTLDEAFWSGDKQAEGILKNLITGSRHVIEHKGKTPYTVENCTRVVIIGNEEWLVPATEDERRFAVFELGDARRQDRTFFQDMREKMEQGGYALLLRYLLRYDLTQVDVNQAPLTEWLLDQKLSSLDPFCQWWVESLRGGKIVASDFGNEWHTEVSKERLRDAFTRYHRMRGISARIPSEEAIGKRLRLLCSSSRTSKKREDGAPIHTYKIPVLDQARKEFEAFIGHTLTWEETTI